MKQKKIYSIPLCDIVCHLHAVLGINKYHVGINPFEDTKEGLKCRIFLMGPHICQQIIRIFVVQIKGQDQFNLEKQTDCRQNKILCS